MSDVEAERGPADQAAPVFRRPALAMLQRVGGDKLVHDVIDVFTVNAPRLISAARAGANSADAAAVFRALHSLKSSAGQLGAARMQQLCDEGEQLAGAGATAPLAALVAHEYFSTGCGAQDLMAYPSSTSRTCCDSVSGVKGFCRNGTSMESSLCPVTVSSA
jgi:HPt (histidine-containing phosphotransfer) domain-containing protein